MTKPATIQEIKQELNTLPPAALAGLCLRLAKYKKENKELLSYLLFEAQDAAGHIQSVREEIAAQFSEINYSNAYFIKKGLRKILRLTAKHIRHIGNKAAEVELLLFFCRQVVSASIPIRQNKAIENLYAQQLKKLTKLIGELHEDLQFEYTRELNELQMAPNTSPRSFIHLFLKKI